jgi:DNA-binding transcriptional LysR family regulator
VEAVRAGFGIGILHSFIARNHPELVELNLTQPIRRNYWLVYHESMRPSRRVQKVAEFISKLVEKERQVFV